jgi:hypothetical protein
VFGQEQCMEPTPQPRSSARRAPRAISSGNIATTAGCGSSQSERPSSVAQRLSQAATAVVETASNAHSSSPILRT